MRIFYKRRLYKVNYSELQKIFKDTEQKILEKHAFMKLLFLKS